MGTAGTRIKNRVDRLLQNANIRSSFTLTPVTRTKGGLGGYEAPTEAQGDARTVYCVPSNYTNFISMEEFGDLQSGDLRVLIKADETVDTDDFVSFQSQFYHIRQVKSIVFNDVVVAKACVLSKEHE